MGKQCDACSSCSCCACSAEVKSLGKLWWAQGVDSRQLVLRVQKLTGGAVWDAGVVCAAGSRRLESIERIEACINEPR